MSKGWRVNLHQDFLHRALRDWNHTILGASANELKTLTDTVRNVYDRVIRLPVHVLQPLKQDRHKVRRVSALSTPLYERRALLLQLPALQQVVRATLDKLRARCYKIIFEPISSTMSTSSTKNKYVREMVLIPKSQPYIQKGGQAPPHPPHPPLAAGVSQPPTSVYWQRPMLLDSINNAPVIDKAIELLQRMKESEGKTNKWPGAGTSEYFRLQNRLQENMPPSKMVQLQNETMRKRDLEAKKEREASTWQPTYPDFPTTSLGETREQVD